MSDEPVEVPRSVLVAECDELMAVLESEIAWDGNVAEQARAHRYWTVLVFRDDYAVEAAVRRAVAPTDPAVTDLWLGFAEELTGWPNARTLQFWQGLIGGN